MSKIHCFLERDKILNQLSFFEFLCGPTRPSVMKNLLISLGLLGVLTGFGAFVYTDTTDAKNDLLTSLLNLPGPPPPNPLVRRREAERPESFFSKKTPPPDDAPIEDLMDYWQGQSERYRELGYNIKPSEGVLGRLLDEIEEDHSKIFSLLGILPGERETADLVKRLYDSVGETEEATGQKDMLKDWLKYNSPYFSDELSEGAQEARDSNEYVTNQRELLSLARIDFSKAQPIINRLYNDSDQPVSRALARWALYRHALETDSFGDIERYRDELKAIVEDKTATDGTRDLAFDALAQEKDWPGRDEWYYGLMEDETLADLQVNGQGYTGLTTIMYYAPPEKYAKKMIELLKSSNPAVRVAAMKNLGLLINKDNPEVIEALLPWLENPNWAVGRGNERNEIIDALQHLTLPDSVPGLITALDETETHQVALDVLTSNSNTSPGPPVRNGSNSSVSNVTSYSYRSSVIPALAMQKDARAVPALRRVLTEVGEYERIGVINAIWMSHGYSVTEQVDAIEGKARENAPDDSNTTVSGHGGIPPLFYRTNESYATANMPAAPTSDDLPDFPDTPQRGPNSNVNAYPAKPRPLTGDEIKATLGGLLVESIEADEPLINGVLDRITALERKEPQTAGALRRIVMNWSGPAVNAMLLRDLKTGKASVDTVVKLLSLRKELAEKQAPAVNDAGSGGPIAEGIAACILNDRGNYDGILGSENAELKTTMLACARLIRADLPVSKVAGLLNAPDKTLALAADRYLESNDSPEARAAVLKAHPGEARIMGATTVFAPADEAQTASDYIPDLFESIPGATNYYPIYLSADYAKDVLGVEKKLQKEVLGDPDLLGIYAYDDNFIRIYKDRAVYSWSDDPARYYERTLSKDEFEAFKNLLAANNVDSMPPFLASREEDYGEPLELLMLGKQGGRRVFYMQSGGVPEFFDRLDDAFIKMSDPPTKLHYGIEKEVPGLEVVVADDLISVDSFWKNGDESRVLTEDPNLRLRIDEELRRQEQENASKEGYDYQKGAEINMKRRAARLYDHLSWRKLDLGKFAEPSTQPPGFEFIPPRDPFSVPAKNDSWKARAQGVEVRTGSEAIYKISRGQETKIGEGNYFAPVVTSDGRWVLLNKYDEGLSLSRINLITNKEFSVKVRAEPLVYVPSINKALVRVGGFKNEAGGPTIGGEYYFLEAETGKLQAVKGEVRPLVQQTYRPLQATGRPDEFWAAIPDDDGKKETQIGVYNAKTLIFSPVQKLPQLSFSSMDMWVDEKQNKIYIVYVGHLLSIPLKSRES
jgi:HEAT repeats